jgi:hypothetical protein
VDRRSAWDLRRLVALVAMLATESILPLHAQQSYAMRYECRTAEPNTPASRRRAEEFVREKLKAFVPTAEQALRMRSLEAEAEQVKLAFYGISTTCEQFLRGTTERDVADNALQGYEQTIANFLHDVSSDVKAVAARAQVSDLEVIRKSLTQIGTTGRQAALLGEEKLADEARKQMVETLVGFSGAFVNETCWDQVFDDELPFSVNRQNEMMGTGIDVRPCAQRRFKAVVPPLTFESCTIRGVGRWEVSWPMPMTSGGRGSGELEAERDGAKGGYKVEVERNDVAYRASGDLKLARRDNGPGNKATYTLSGEMDIKLIKGEEVVKKMAQLMGQKVGGKQNFSVEADVSDKPCRSLEG